jgi:NHL repeat
MKSLFQALTLALIGLATCASGQNPVVSPQNRPPHYASAPQEIQAFAATNSTFALAVDYLVATLDGRQPDHLPDGVSPKDIYNAMRVVFPKANIPFDQPINFFGMVLDERDQPVAGANVQLQWTGFLIHGSASSNLITDQEGLFFLTNQLGIRLSVSVNKSGYYPTRQNANLGSFVYAVADGEVIHPDPARPITYHLRKKGPGANSLVTSQYGVYQDFSVRPPSDGTPFRVDLLARKTGDGPLTISQVKTNYAHWRNATNWSFSFSLTNGGFVEEDEEFPFTPPSAGYQSRIEFYFDKSNSNWATGLEMNYYIKFGTPSVYGRLNLVTEISSDYVRLIYVINPDGSRDLEPRNETSPPLPPPPVATNTGWILASNGMLLRPPTSSATSNLSPAPVCRCVTIAGMHGVAGNADGTNLSASFNQPWGIAAAPNGDVYVADFGNNTIRRLQLEATNWVVTTIAGLAGGPGSEDGWNEYARFNRPHGLMVGRDNTIYVADDGNATIRKIARFGTNWHVTTIAGQPGIFGNADGTNLNAQFNNPSGITMDRHGDLYVSDVGNNAIRKLTRAGTNWIVTTIAGKSGMIQEGHVLHPAWGSSDGTNSDARFFAPFDVVADTHDSLFVVDYENSTIRKIIRERTNWVTTTIAGMPGMSGYIDGTNKASRFDHPRAVAVDRAGRVYISDPGTDTIRVLAEDGTNWVVRTAIGLPWRWGYADGTNNFVQFNSASGIAVDASGQLFVADTGNQVIREIFPPKGPQPASRKGLFLLLVTLFLLAALSLILFQQRFRSAQHANSEKNTNRFSEQ